jgi:hypothetical protein
MPAENIMRESKISPWLSVREEKSVHIPAPIAKTAKAILAGFSGCFRQALSPRPTFKKAVSEENIISHIKSLY